MGFVFFAVIGAALFVAGGFWWMMQMPMYFPGKMVERTDLDPHNTENDTWEVSEGIKLYHFSSGQGKNVLCIHGGPSLPWVKSTAALDRIPSHKFHYYDQRGTGRSTRPTFDFSPKKSDTYNNIKQLVNVLGLEEQLADIERIRKTLGDERITLVGHSFGGLFAALYAAEFPQNVEKLVLVAPANVVVMPLKGTGLFDAVLNRLKALPDSEAIVEEYNVFLKKYFDFGQTFTVPESEIVDLQKQFVKFFELAAPEQGDGVPTDEVQDMDMFGGYCSRAQYFSMGRRHNWTKFLGRITAPTLIIQGTEDFQPVEVANQYERWIGENARVATIEGGGHFILSTHPEPVSQIIDAFLNE